MLGRSHRKVSIEAAKIFHQLTNALTAEDIGGDPLVRSLAEYAVDTDRMRDLEFVDVDLGKDDPHANDLLEDSDEAHYTESGKELTAFNHFIDIKKGPGLFDDYDGYSYNKGSASHDEFQDASDATEVEDVKTFFAEILSRITGMKIDEGLNWWLNDEYVHASCHPWYRNCSPSLDRYSFPGDRGEYATVREELAKRFPRADSMGGSGKGVPYSVFMPVDNLARYWYGQATASASFRGFGRVLHAVQDASVLHHATGYMGNWHSEYEHDLDEAMDYLLGESGFTSDVIERVEAWNREDPAPPTVLGHDEWSLTPAKNWRTDRLVTWLALHAYKHYEERYMRFRDGYSRDPESIRELAVLAVAMSVLVMIKAHEETSGKLFTYVGNRKTKEVHYRDCWCVSRMKEENMVSFPLFSEADKAHPDYNGCFYCLRSKDED